MKRAALAAIAGISLSVACAQIIGADFDVRDQGDAGPTPDASTGDAGVCDAARCPMEIARGFDFPWDIAVNGGTVYFTVRGVDGTPTGMVVAVSTQGGAATPLANQQYSPNRLYVAANDVYWTATSEDGGVYRVARDGTGEVQAIATDQRFALGVTGDGTYVYWTADGHVKRLPVGDTGPGDLVTDAGYGAPCFPVLDDSGQHVFVTEFGVPGLIRRISTDGAHDDIIASGFDYPNALIRVGGRLYFATFEDDGWVGSVGTDGGTVTLIQTGLARPGGLASDGEYVYWAEFVDGGTVSRSPIDGGDIEILAAGQPGPNGVALDEDFVYWTNHVKGGSVMKVSKKPQ